MLRYYRARDERSTVVMTERLGHAHSPLTVDEMLEALNDPRFNVRFEAIISIARTAPHPRLTETLAAMVSGSEVALSVVAAWALGRIGDKDALPALREGLDSDYKSVRMHCARALGTLDDQTISPMLAERLRSETDRGLQMAYASALGNLQAAAAIDTIFGLMADFDNQGARLELALSLARMTGSEHQFVRLLRQARDDSGTTIAQELIHLSHEAPLNGLDPAALRACIDAFAHEDLAAGKAQLVALLRALPNGATTSGKLLHGCADGLERDGHTEYVLLALHVLHG
jgi:HEAT repeat protein